MPGTGPISTLVRTSDGRGLHVLGLPGTGRGAQDTLVVLESGMGIGGRFWGPVQRGLAGMTGALVVAYDRAGHGHSDRDRAPRTLARLADDLETVVDAFPHSRLVLVGHSWGGPIVRTLAARLRDRGRTPAGLVLVDPADENCELYFTPSVRVSAAMQDLLYLPLAATGLLLPFSRAVLRGLPASDLTAAAWASSTLTAARATIAENRCLTGQMRGLRVRRPNLGDMPTVIITGVSAKLFEGAVRTSLNEAHRLSAAQLPQGRLVEARNSAHLVPITEPELVVREIQAMLQH